MKEDNVRPGIIVRVMPYTLIATFTSTNEEINAQRMPYEPALIDRAEQGRPHGRTFWEAFFYTLGGNRLLLFLGFSAGRHLEFEVE